MPVLIGPNNTIIGYLHNIINDIDQHEDPHFGQKMLEQMEKEENMDQLITQIIARIIEYIKEIDTNSDLQQIKEILPRLIDILRQDEEDIRAQIRTLQIRNYTVEMARKFPRRTYMMEDTFRDLNDLLGFPDTSLQSSEWGSSSSSEDQDD